MGSADAEHSVNPKLSKLTNGVLETAKEEKVKYAQDDYVTVDLGANYEVAAVGAYWPDSAWHLYKTSVFVTADKPSAENMKTADITIDHTSCWEGPNNSFNKKNAVKVMTEAKDGRYVSFKKISDGAAYLSELYVFAYVDKTAKTDFYFVNNEASVEAKVEGENTENYNVFTASYKDGKLVEVKQGAVQKGEDLQYKGFVWNKTDINPILPSINF